MSDREKRFEFSLETPVDPAEVEQAIRQALSLRQLRVLHFHPRLGPWAAFRAGWKAYATAYKDRLR